MPFLEDAARYWYEKPLGGKLLEESFEVLD